MAILVTDIGLSAITNAEAGGFLVNLTHFEVTEAQDVELKISDEVLEAEPVYKSEIESIEVVSSSTVKLTLYIPPNKPATGSWTLTELGLRLKTGELFAHGTFRVPHVKTNSGLRIFVYVTADRLGEVINVTLGTNSSLASSANVRSLIAPQSSATNAVVVQDGASTAENNLLPTAGGLAVRYGPGGINWAFLGYDMVFHGQVTGTTSPDWFDLNAESQGGFWLNDGEVAIAQIVSGKGSGESRRVQYSKEWHTFAVLEKPYSELDTNSVINIWRSTKNQLPQRTPNLDTNFVLGVGENTWRRTTQEDMLNGFAMSLQRSSFAGDGNKSAFQMPNSVTSAVFENPTYLQVYVGGELLLPNQYALSISGILNILGGPPATGVTVDVLVHNPVASTGAFLTANAIEYIATGDKWTFYTSIIPDSSHYILVFLDGKLVPMSQYIYADTSITFTQAAPTGILSVVQFANYDEVGASTRILRKEVASTVPMAGIVMDDVQFVEKRNTLVMVAGKYLSKEEYDVDVNSVKIRATLPVGAMVTVIAYINEAQEYEVREVLGINTGPVWVDPAGRYMRPNKIVATRKTFTGNGATRTYAVMANVDYAMVFVSGLFQDPSDVFPNRTMRSVTLSEAVATGREIDIISFEMVDDAGEEMLCERHQFTTRAGQASYPLPEIADGNVATMEVVSIGGVYAHASAYNLSNAGIAFINQPEPEMKVEVWRFVSVPRKGHSNAILWRQFQLKRDVSDYAFCYADALPVDDTGRENNTLLFGSTVMQMGTDYNVANTDDGYKFIIPNVQSEDGVTCSAFVFASGASKTRLITREELSRRYITRAEVQALAGGFVGGGGGGGIGGGGNTGGGGDGDGDGGSGESGSDAKAVFLQATSQIFVTASDGSVLPDKITFTANVQNMPGTVTYTTYDGVATLGLNGNIATLNFVDMMTDSVTIRASMVFDNATYFDYITVVKLADGSDALNAMLTNEVHTVPADINGNVSDYSNVVTSMRIYQGAVEIGNQYTFTKADSIGVSSTISGSTVKVTAMSVDEGYVDILASRTGSPTLVKRFSVAKSKSGLNGTNGLAGKDAIFGTLDNEAFIFAASSTGLVTNFSGAVSRLRVFEGSADTTSSWTITKTDSAGVTSTLAGAVVTITGFSTNNDTGEVTFTAKKAGYPDVTRKFTLTKMKGSSSAAGTPGADGKRGSMTFYIPNRASWSDPAATTAATYNGGPMLNDTVMQYSATFAQTRFWNGSAWVVLDARVNGNLLVDGTVGANAMSARSITAYNGAIDDLAVKTLNIAGNAVTQAQSTTMGTMQQFEINSAVAQAVLSMVVTITGTQPIMVWSSWANPGCRIGTASDYDAAYWGQFWKMNTQWSEAQVFFRLTRGSTSYTAGYNSTSVYPGYTLSAALSAIFTDVPAGTYTLSLMMNKALASLLNFSVRSASLAMLETKR